MVPGKAQGKFASAWNLPVLPVIAPHEALDAQHPWVLSKSHRVFRAKSLSRKISQTGSPISLVSQDIRLYLTYLSRKISNLFRKLRLLIKNMSYIARRELLSFQAFRRGRVRS